GFGLAAGTGDALRAPGLHHRLTVRLLIETDLHHVDAYFEPEKRAGEGERRAPLPGAGLGGEPPDPGLLVVKGLRHRGIRLMAAGGAPAPLFLVNFCRGIGPPPP